MRTNISLLLKPQNVSRLLNKAAFRVGLPKTFPNVGIISKVIFADCPFNVLSRFLGMVVWHGREKVVGHVGILG